MKSKKKIDWEGFAVPKNSVVLLTGKAYTQFREAVFMRANGLCETCKMYAPLREEGYPNIFSCGHVSHIIPRKRGGDTLENVLWECYNCHINYKHGPRWSKKTIQEEV